MKLLKFDHRQRLWDVLNERTLSTHLSSRLRVETDLVDHVNAIWFETGFALKRMIKESMDAQSST